MAGERSRASFLLQLGLRAIAAGNTGGARAGRWQWMLLVVVAAPMGCVRWLGGVQKASHPSYPHAHGRCRWRNR